ncbi:MAG TPA: manganese transporter, partial [Planctomycetaceae bacterium]|nr:manganese transporter [Planctomycetaceae bacterium]
MASDAPQDTPDVVTPTYKTPPKTWGGMLLAIGPAIVVSGSVIGSGELINVPIQAAKFGFV